MMQVFVFCILLTTYLQYGTSLQSSLQSLPHPFTSPRSVGASISSSKTAILSTPEQSNSDPSTDHIDPTETFLPVASTDRAWYSPDLATPVDTMNSVDQTWSQLEDFGELLTRYSKTSLFARAFFAGLFVGFGGILTCSVGFDMGGAAGVPWLAGNGFARFLSGAVGFPLSILLISCTGCGAWTGDMLLVSRALFSKSKRTDLKAVLRFATMTWLGCLVGAVSMAALATLALLPAVSPCIAIAEHKLSYNFLQTFLRATAGGCLICLAIFISKLNRDMMGKAVGIWFPISTYVICDFEHVLASMFFLSCAKFNGASITYKQILGFLVPSTLGNLAGGALLIGFGLFSIPKKIKFMINGDVVHQEAV